MGIVDDPYAGPAGLAATALVAVPHFCAVAPALYTSDSAGEVVDLYCGVECGRTLYSIAERISMCVSGCLVNWVVVYIRVV